MRPHRLGDASSAAAIAELNLGEREAGLELLVGESSHATPLDRVALTIAAGTGERSRFAAGLEQCLERALGLGADYDVLVVLALAEATGDSRRAVERDRADAGP